MKKSLLLLLVAVLVLSLALVAGCTKEEAPAAEQPAAAEEPAAEEMPSYELRLSSEYTEDNHQTVALKEAAAEIEAATDGHVKITVYPNMALGDYTVVYGQVMTGDIDICANPIASSYGANADIVNMPYLSTGFDTYKESYFPGGFVYDTIAALNEGNGTVLLGIMNTGFMGLGISADSLAATDFAYLTDGATTKDVLLRVPGVTIYTYIMPSLGYNTTTIPYSDLYAALQAGVADGWIGGSGLVNYESFRDVIHYFVDANVINESIPITMNKELLESMPEEYQTIIKDAFLNVATRVADERQEQEAQALVDMASYGITVIEPTDEELTALADRVRAEVWPQMIGIMDDELIKSLCDDYGIAY